MKIATRISLFAIASVTLFANLALSQTKLIDPSVPPPPPPDHAASKPDATPPAPPAKFDPSVPPPAPNEEADEEPAKPDLVAYDPLGAERSITVGQFYLKQGNYDAAIDRFVEATKMHPNYGKPYELLGVAYEKKHNLADAHQVISTVSARLSARPRPQETRSAYCRTSEKAAGRGQAGSLTLHSVTAARRRNSTHPFNKFCGQFVRRELLLLASKRG